MKEVTRHLELSADEIRFYKSEGYLIVPGFLEDAAVPRLRDEVAAVMEAAFGLSRDDLEHAASRSDKLRQCGQYLPGSAIDALINGGNTIALASALLGGDAHVYMPFTAVKAAGGGGQFHMHQDNSYTRHEPAMGSLNIWVALVDMTPENGCLRVIPRSHRAGQLDSHNAGDGDSHREVDFDPELIFPVRMRAGDAVVFSRWTVHGSGPNESGEPRFAYALQFHRGDVTFLDPTDQSWKRLVDFPRWKTGPVDALHREG